MGPVNAPATFVASATIAVATTSATAWDDVGFSANIELASGVSSGFFTLCTGSGFTP
jgi:hypothetical protein